LTLGFLLEIGYVSMFLGFRFFFYKLVYVLAWAFL